MHEKLLIFLKIVLAIMALNLVFWAVKILPFFVKRIKLNKAKKGL